MEVHNLISGQEAPMTDAPISPLRQRMIDDMTMRRMAPKTQAAYIRAVAHSDARRAPIPMERGQSFRLIAGSESDATRA